MKRDMDMCRIVSRLTFIIGHEQGGEQQVVAAQISHCTCLVPEPGCIQQHDVGDDDGIKKENKLRKREKIMTDA